MLLCIILRSPTITGSDKIIYVAKTNILVTQNVTLNLNYNIKLHKFWQYLAKVITNILADWTVFK